MVLLTHADAGQGQGKGDAGDDKKDSKTPIDLKAADLAKNESSGRGTPDDDKKQGGPANKGRVGGGRRW